MTDKKEQQDYDNFQKDVEKTRAAMATPVADREAWAVFDNESGAYMLQGVFGSEDDAEGAVRRILSKRNPDLSAHEHVFVAELSAVAKKYKKSRSDGLSKEDLKKPTRPDVSKRSGDSDYADKEALDESEVRPLI